MPVQRISFTVPGVMRGKQRAGRKLLAGGKVHSFNPRKTADLEHSIKVRAALLMRAKKPFSGAVALDITVTKLHPRSWSEKKKRAAQWVVGRPDCDNIAKLIADALNKIVWHDDAQVASLTVSRTYSAVEQTLITISTLEDA